MLIVMLVLLMSTATALFAVHSTTYEIRASGHMRRAMQTQYVAETGVLSGLAWVDRWGPGTLLRAMRRTAQINRANGDPAINLAPFNEPELADGKDAYRLTLSELESPTGVVPASRETMGGNRQAFEPEVFLDVYDAYTYTGVLPGQRSDGRGRLRFLRATYTSRGRTRVPGGGDFTEFYEGASDARAHGLSGPYGG
jgi:hypothetical protein